MTSTNPGTEREILDHLRRLIREVRLADAGSRRQAGISTPQLYLLERLAELAAPTLAELGDAAQADAETVGLVARVLEHKGFVELDEVAEPGNSRVRLLPAGEALLARAPATPGTRILRALRAMPPAEREQLHSALGSLAGALGVADRPVAMLGDDMLVPGAS